MRIYERSTQAIAGNSDVRDVTHSVRTVPYAGAAGVHIVAARLEAVPAMEG
jgi:hypothetical protein